MTTGVQPDDLNSLSSHIKEIAQEVSNSEKYKKLVSGELYPGYVVKVKLSASIEDPQQDDKKYVRRVNLTNSQEIDNQINYTQPTEPTDRSWLLGELDRIEADDPGLFPFADE